MTHDNNREEEGLKTWKSLIKKHIKKVSAKKYKVSDPMK